VTISTLCNLSDVCPFVERWIFKIEFFSLDYFLRYGAEEI